ncbi:MAG: hypothetical protein ABI616_00060 [Pseudomonadota bacterium]
MNAMLRMALTYFSIVPLQKWLSIAGAILVAIALLAHSPPFAVAAFLGAFFIVFVPLVMGGTSMRFGSSRSTLQLRPGARWKMLAASLLTICVMTAICALTLWAATQAMGSARPGPGAKPPFTLVQFAFALWGAFGLFWLMSFVASASRLWSLPICIGFIAIISRSRELFNALGSPPMVLAGAATIAWLVFAFWYLQAREVRRPGWVGSTSPVGMGENNTGGWYSTLTESRGDSRAVAIRTYLLGTSSRLGYLLPGLLSALVILPFYLLQRKASSGVAALPVTFVTIFSGIAGGLSYMVARRARMLWLRAGLDRSGLFAVGERTALQAFALMVVTAAIVLAAFSIAVKPDLASRILVYAVSQMAYATVLFYFGLAQTRGWTAGAIGGCILLGLGLIVQMILLLPQTTGISPVVAPVMIAISVLLSLLLRQHARRRWQTLDWHLNRPAVIARRTL